MSEKEYKFYIFALLGLGLSLILALGCLTWEHGTVRRLKEQLSKRDTIRVTEVRVDTIRDSVPVLVGEKQVGVIKVPVYDKITTHEEGSSGKMSGVIGAIPAMQPTSIDTLTLPLTQKEYSDDSTYTAWVSGYLPRLDSIRVYRKTVTNTVTIQSPPTSKKRSFWSRFSLGVQGGYGIGLDDKKGHPYVGLGVGFGF